MRTVPVPTLAALQQDLGTEPILIIGVTWSDDGGEILYSDQRIDGAAYPYPTLTQISSFDTALLVSGSGDSQSISVILDDIDGTLKSIFNSHDIHKRSVKVYQLFRGIALANKFLLFDGEINSPVIWNEGERTLAFTVLTRAEDADVAFSMEEGDFPQIPVDALGKVWPLVFGQVCNMETVQVRAPRKGFLTAGEGWGDFTIEPRLCQARYIQCPSVVLGSTKTIKRAPDNSYITSDVWQYGPDQECVDDRFEVICNLLYRQQQEDTYEHSVLTIRGGDAFPQAEQVTISVDSAILRGSFSGNTFTVTDREHPDYAEWDHVACASVQNHAYGIIPARGSAGNQWEETSSGTAWFNNQSDIETLADCDLTNSNWTRGSIGGPSASWQAYESMGSAGFVWKPSGTEVFLEAEGELLYIVSLLPGTVDSVTAYKTQPSGRALLMEVPSAYYTVYNTDYDGYVDVEIGFDKKLSLIDPDWGDTIYVSFTSSVGPNPVDIIEWLLAKYTSLTPDAATFAAVQAQMANYPCNFAIKDRRNILDLIHDIAYQTRCAVYTRDGTMYIVYLSDEPSSVRTLTTSDILADTFEISLTETEDIVTKHVIDWEKADAGVEDSDETGLKIILKHNVDRYGISEETHDYYTQNTYDTILKSATFWLIRNAHTWKHVEFDTPLKHLDLDIFDCITVDVAQFSPTPIKVVIEEATYNPDDNSIHFKCWTPVLAGTDTVYSWAWPAQQDAARRFPLVQEIADAGAGYTFNVTPPIGHILRSGYVDTGDGSPLIMSSGDQNPSDIGDTFPTTLCEVSSTNEVEEDDPTFQALTLARRTRDRVSEGQMTKDMRPPGGLNVNNGQSEGLDDPFRPEAPGDRDEKPEKEGGGGPPCGSPALGNGCVWEVQVQYVTPDLVTSGKILGGCLGGPCWRNEAGGGVCTNTDLTTYGFWFDRLTSAEAFFNAKQTEISALHSSCGYYTDKTAPFSVSWVGGIEDPETSVTCADKEAQQLEEESDPEYESNDSGLTISSVGSSDGDYQPEEC